MIRHGAVSIFRDGVCPGAREGRLRHFAAGPRRMCCVSRRRSSTSTSWPQNAGAAADKPAYLVTPANMSLLAELRDSQSGAMLARVADRNRGRSAGNLQVADQMAYDRRGARGLRDVGRSAARSARCRAPAAARELVMRPPRMRFLGGAGAVLRRLYLDRSVFVACGSSPAGLEGNLVAPGADQHERWRDTSGHRAFALHHRVWHQWRAQRALRLQSRPWKLEIFRTWQCRIRPAGTDTRDVSRGLPAR